MKHSRTIRQIERKFFPGISEERLQKEFDVLSPREQGREMAKKDMRNFKRRLKRALKGA